MDEDDLFMMLASMMGGQTPRKKIVKCLSW